MDRNPKGPQTNNEEGIDNINGHINNPFIEKTESIPTQTSQRQNATGELSSTIYPAVSRRTYSSNINNSQVIDSDRSSLSNSIAKLKLIGALIVLAVIIGASYVFVFMPGFKIQSSNNNDWKTYKIDGLGVEFKYPPALETKQLRRAEDFILYDAAIYNPDDYKDMGRILVSSADVVVQTKSTFRWDYENISLNTRMGKVDAKFKSGPDGNVGGMVYRYEFAKEGRYYYYQLFNVSESKKLMSPEDFKLLIESTNMITKDNKISATDQLIDETKALDWLNSFYANYITITGSDTSIYNIVNNRDSNMDESVEFVKKNSTQEYFTEFSSEIYASNRSGHGEDILMCTLYSAVSSVKVVSSKVEADGLSVVVNLYGERGQNDSPMENNIKVVYESDMFKIKSSYCPMSRS